jgi:hypothetical protein
MDPRDSVNEINFAASSDVRQYFLSNLEKSYGDNLTENGFLPIDGKSSEGKPEVYMMSLESMADKQLQDFEYFAYEVASESLDYNESAPDSDIITESENDEIFTYSTPVERLFSQIVLHYYGYGSDGMICKHFSHDDKVNIVDFTKEYATHIDEDLDNFLPKVNYQFGDNFNKLQPVSEIEMDLYENPEIIFDALIDETKDVQERSAIYEDIASSARHSDSNALSKMFEPAAYFLLCGKLAVGEPEFVKNLKHQYSLLEYGDDVHPLVPDRDNDFLSKVIMDVYKEAFPVKTKKQYNRGVVANKQVPF